VRKGAKSMTILAPVTRSTEEMDEATGETKGRRVLVGYKAVRVFDETALVAPPARADVLPELLTGKGTKEVYDALAARVRTAGFELEDGDCAPANGRTDWITRTVTVRPDLEPAQRTKTLAHELGHIQLHDPERAAEMRMSRERMEVEAESVAYLVCAHVGIDSATYTVPYVANWAAGNVELVQETAERVIEAARTVTEALDQALSPAIAPELTRSRELVQSPNDVEARARSLHPSMTAQGRDRDLDAVRTRVEAEAAALIARLAANPDAWGANPEERDVVQRLASGEAPHATARVVSARQRLADLIHHPAPPQPADLVPAVARDLAPRGD
jgi:hypothetical protein